MVNRTKQAAPPEQVTFGVMLLKLVTSFIGLVSCVVSAMLWASDDAVLYRFKQGSSTNEAYTFELAKTALARTEQQFGAYSVSYSQEPMVRNRLRLEILSGNLINVAAVSPASGWEKAIRVPIPLYKGLASYRLFLVRAEDKDRFAQVKDVEDLKSHPTGVNTQWATAKILRSHGFEIVPGYDYKPMFHMLSHGRFDSFIRGANEVYEELSRINDEFPQLVLEPNVALFTYLPLYFYVSPKAKSLAERLEVGMRDMIADGSFDRLFERFYGDDLAAAKLEHRKIFYLENVNIPASYYETDRPYLLDSKKFEQTSDTAPAGY